MQDDPLEIVPDRTPVNKKNILALSADKLKKEAFMLGLYSEGDKSRKDQVLATILLSLAQVAIILKPSNSILMVQLSFCLRTEQTQ